MAGDNCVCILASCRTERLLTTKQDEMKQVVLVVVPIPTSYQYKAEVTNSTQELKSSTETQTSISGSEVDETAVTSPVGTVSETLVDEEPASPSD